MENVVNSKRYLQTAYTFKDLGLAEWANKNRISPLKIAIDLYENTTRETDDSKNYSFRR